MSCGGRREHNANASAISDAVKDFNQTISEHLQPLSVASAQRVFHGLVANAKRKAEADGKTIDQQEAEAEARRLLPGGLESYHAANARLKTRRRSKEKISADRAKIMAAVTDDWQRPPRSAKATDLDALVKAGLIESEVREEYDAEYSGASQSLLPVQRHRRYIRSARPGSRQTAPATTPSGCRRCGNAPEERLMAGLCENCQWDSESAHDRIFLVGTKYESADPGTCVKCGEYADGYMCSECRHDYPMSMCLRCGSETHGYRKFCSDACSTAYAADGRDWDAWEPEQLAALSDDLERGIN